MIAAVHDFLIIMSVMIEGLVIEVLFHAGRAAVVDTIRRARVAIIKLAAGSPFGDISIEPPQLLHGWCTGSFIDVLDVVVNEDHRTTLLAVESRNTFCRDWARAKALLRQLQRS